MRKAILFAIVVVAVACLCLFFFPARPAHRLTLHAYYRHPQNVRKGTLVCVDGVQVGSVDNVTVRPELGDRPVDVVVTIDTPYELRIPTGSTAQIASLHEFGPTVVDIDTHTASGPPIADGGLIEGRESTDDPATHGLEVIVKTLDDQLKALDDQLKARDQKKTVPVP